MADKTTFEYAPCPLQNEEAEFTLYWKTVGVLGAGKQYKLKGVDCALRDQDMCPDENGICETLYSFYAKRIP